MSKSALRENRELQEGDRVFFNGDNVYSKAIKEVHLAPDTYPSFEEVSAMTYKEMRKNENYNCYTFSVNGSSDETIRAGIMDVLDF